MTLQTINSEIELKTGDYINANIYKYSINNFNIDEYSLISVESYEYGKNNNKIINEYENKLPSITNKIILNNYSDNDDMYVLSNLLNCLKLAPKLTIPIIVYRGLSKELNMSKNNNMFEHTTPLWCSFHIDFANQFSYDTSQCYNNNGFNDFNGINYNQKGIILKINVPMSVPCFERFMIYDLTPHDTYSEVILLPGLLKINHYNNNIIECDYIKR